MKKNFIAAFALILSAGWPVMGGGAATAVAEPARVPPAGPRDAHPKTGGDAYDAVVSHDFSAGYKDLQPAINAAPDNGQKPFRILVKPSTYQGRFIVPKEKAHIQLIGEDVTNTAFTCALNQNEPPTPDGKPVDNNAGTVVLGDDFRAENITFQNTSGDHGQALALRVDGDRAVFNHCRMLGWQDTLLLNKGRDYLTNCYVEGRVDFIYGPATAVFDRCEIHSKNGGHITAASTPKEKPFGLVFLNCRLTGDPALWINPANPAAATSPKKPMADLGRPWRPYAERGVSQLLDGRPHQARRLGQLAQSHERTDRAVRRIQQHRPRRKPGAARQVVETTGKSGCGKNHRRIRPGRRR